MRRKDREMPETFALSVVDASDFATLSLVDPEGAPYGVSIQIVRDERTLYFHSAKEGFKIECLKNNPNICLTCVANYTVIPEEFTTKYQSSVIRGVASEVCTDSEKIKALTLLGERFAPNHLPLLGKEIAGHLNATSVWKVEITSATGKEHK